MDILYRRRAALFCFSFVYVGFVSVFLPETARTVLAGLSALLLFVSLFVKGRRDSFLSPQFLAVFRLALLAVIFSLAVFGFYQNAHFDRPMEKYTETSTEITATIRDTAYDSAAGTAYIADITTAAGDRFRVLLKSGESGLSVGDRIRCTAAFTPLHEYSGAFPEKRFYRASGVALVATAEKAAYIGRDAFSLRGAFSALQTSLGGMLFADLSKEGGGLAAALFLGDRSALPDTLTRDFRRLGVSHLLAISGLHFSLLLAGVDRILSLCIRSKKVRILFLIAADIAYMLLCGCTETVARAGIMMLIAYAALFMGKGGDLPTALGIASFLLCLADPSAFYSVGFQLSVTSVLALDAASHMEKTLFPDKLSKRRDGMLKALAALSLPMIVQIALLPLLCLYFGEISLITPISTVLLTPIISLLLLLTPIYLLVRAVQPLSVPLATVINALTASCEWIAASVASLRGITLSLVQPFTPYFAAALSGTVLTVPLCKNRAALKRHLLGGTAILFLFTLTLSATAVLSAGHVKIISAASGKNDSVIITDTGDTMLIDISDGSFSALSYAYSAAAAEGATEIEALLLTHLHSRHVQSIPRLLDTVYVRALISPAPETESEMSVYAALSAMAEAENLPLYTYNSADKLQWGNRVEIALAPREYLSRSTHPVIALSVRANGTVFSYLGAAGSEISALQDQSKADILVLGAHGPIYKKEIAVTLSPQLRALVCRADADKLLSSVIKEICTDTTTRIGAEPVRFILKP